MILSLQLGICLLSGRDLGWIHTAAAEIYISHGRAVRMGSTPKLVCVLPDLVQVVDLIVITVYACHGKDLLGIGYSRRDISISVIKGYTDIFKMLHRPGLRILRIL